MSSQQGSDTDSTLATIECQRRVWPLAEASRDWVAEEVPVALVYNGISHAVMMCSPSDLEELALGFSLTEGIIEAREDIYAIDLFEREQGFEVSMELSSRCLTYLKTRKRSLEGRTGCGLCGIESLSQIPKIEPAQRQAWRGSNRAIQAAVESLQLSQLLQQKTGAVHAAAWCNVNGEIEQVYEDVGRHNALDKLIGSLINKERLLTLTSTSIDEGFVLVSSRASYEMVQKASSANISCLVAVSAATSMAISAAQTSGMTLIGFARQGRHVIYAHGELLQD